MRAAAEAESRAEGAPGRCSRPASRVPALLRERTFRRYWSAQTISMFGDQISFLALPLTAVLALHARAAQMGYLTAAIWLPSLLFAVHAGMWADRLGRRRVLMIAADVGRAALLVSVPVCYVLHVLTLTQLYAVAFAAGALSTLFTVCDASVSVAIMPDDKLRFLIPGQVEFKMDFLLGANLLKEFRLELDFRRKQAQSIDVRSNRFHDDGSGLARQYLVHALAEKSLHREPETRYAADA